jgi:hypothetical protein
MASITFAELANEALGVRMVIPDLV